MPELPEVETIVRGLEPILIGKRIKSLFFLSAHLKKKQPAWALRPETYKDQKIEKITRRGKLIIISLERQKGLLVHLKMTGQLFLAEPGRPLDKHTHAVMTFYGLKKELRFRDLRKFGLINCLPKSQIEEKVAKSLGPEPLEVKLKEFRRLLETRGRKKIKSWLLDQKIIAGIGNIYSDEILFQSGIHPERLSGSLSLEESWKLFRAMKSVLKKAIRFKGSSISDYIDSLGQRGEFQKLHQVYGRENQMCRRCRAARIERKKIGGRSSFFCPNCQV
ncbi:MAG: bifunctional DNA-formamidopyrimidine glycosylase/DNA-(apurinic or apyrimidinic site) lyase [Candidatus Saccharicenans sp.]|nr:bifunctional DNA-formamidopyrimidine glycosylase/DNA-(apurinic or apyrimidinic site) lyase [Candidatus Aminicenantes bacterium]